MKTQISLELNLNLNSISKFNWLHIQLKRNGMEIDAKAIEICLSFSSFFITVF